MPFSHMSWQALSREQQSEQIVPLWNGQAAMSGRSNVSPQTTHSSSTSDISPSGVMIGGWRSSTRAM